MAKKSGMVIVVPKAMQARKISEITDDPKLLAYYEKKGIKTVGEAVDNKPPQKYWWPVFQKVAYEILQRKYGLCKDNFTCVVKGLCGWR